MALRLSPRPARVAVLMPDRVRGRPDEEMHLLSRAVWEALGVVWVCDVAVKMWASELIAAHLYAAGFVVEA